MVNNHIRASDGRKILHPVVSKSSQVCESRKVLDVKFSSIGKYAAEIPRNTLYSTEPVLTGDFCFFVRSDIRTKIEDDTEHYLSVFRVQNLRNLLNDLETLKIEDPNTFDDVELKVGIFSTAGINDTIAEDAPVDYQVKLERKTVCAECTEELSIGTTVVFLGGATIHADCIDNFTETVESVVSKSSILFPEFI